MRPFSEASLSDILRVRLEQVTAEIKALDADYALKASTVELQEHFVEKAHVEPLVLHVDEMSMGRPVGIDIDVSRDSSRVIPPGRRVTVRGTRLDIAIPYEGDRQLWRFRPSSFSLGGYPEVEVLTDRIQFSVEFADDAADAERVRRDIDWAVRQLGDAADAVGRDVDEFNSNLPQSISAAVETRKRRAEATTGVVGALGIPMRRASEPTAYAIPVRRRKSRSQLPSVQAEPYQPEPRLEMEEYEHVLEILRSMSLVIERNPKSFAHLREEDIRDQFLIPLNAHYEGLATGETFNAAGKTDILIRAGDRNVFIAECKFWRGPKYFDDAVSQLLSYLSWRDSKCALLVFNRGGNSTAIYQKMHEGMLAREECKKALGRDSRDDNRYTFVKDSDPGREITITTMLFDVPTELEGRV